jgi:hypothetical protein
VQGLGLRDFTEYGWTDSDDGRMHVGEGQHQITEREPWRTNPDFLASVAAAVAADIAAAAAADFEVQSPTSNASSATQWDKNTTEKLRGDVAPYMNGASLEDSFGDTTLMDVMNEMNLSTVTASRTRVVQGDKCWWSPKGRTCEDYYASFTLPDGTVVPGGTPSQREQQTTQLRNNATGNYIPDEERARAQQYLPQQELHNIKIMNSFTRGRGVLQPCCVLLLIGLRYSNSSTCMCSLPQWWRAMAHAINL